MNTVSKCGHGTQDPFTHTHPFQPLICVSLQGLWRVPPKQRITADCRRSGEAAQAVCEARPTDSVRRCRSAHRVLLLFGKIWLFFIEVVIYVKHVMALILFKKLILGIFK